MKGSFNAVTVIVPYVDFITPKLVHAGIFPITLDEFMASSILDKSQADPCNGKIVMRSIWRETEVVREEIKCSTSLAFSLSNSWDNLSRCFAFNASYAIHLHLNNGIRCGFMIMCVDSEFLKHSDYGFIGEVKNRETEGT